MTSENTHRDSYEHLSSAEALLEKGDLTSIAKAVAHALIAIGQRLKDEF